MSEPRKLKIKGAGAGDAPPLHPVEPTPAQASVPQSAPVQPAETRPVQQTVQPQQSEHPVRSTAQSAAQPTQPAQPVQRPVQQTQPTRQVRRPEQRSVPTPGITTRPERNPRSKLESTGELNLGAVGWHDAERIRAARERLERQRMVSTQGYEMERRKEETAKAAAKAAAEAAAAKAAAERAAAEAAAQAAREEQARREEAARRLAAERQAQMGGVRRLDADLAGGGGVAAPRHTTSGHSRPIKTTSIRRSDAVQPLPEKPKTPARAPAKMPEKAAAQPAARKAAAPTPIAAPVPAAPKKAEARPEQHEQKQVSAAVPSKEPTAEQNISKPTMAKHTTKTEAAAAHKPHSKGSAAAAKTAAGAAEAKTGKKSGSKKSGGKKAKKKFRWWQVLLATLLALGIIFFGTFQLIMHAVAPKAGNLSINQLINTPKEYAGDYLNVLVLGVDWEEERGQMYSDSSNDGMTDMIMYVHMDFVNGTVSMLQFPRNIMVTKDASLAGNYQINSVARTNGVNNNNNYGALAEVIHEQFKLPVDGYVAVNMESFTYIVDTLGGIEVLVPHEIDNGKGSHLDAGYQNMTGEMAEFFVRNRYGSGYANSDIDRLNMQRYFYAGLFRRLKTMTAWDVAKMMPLFVAYCETDLAASDIISLGVSMLKIKSSNMMLCQIPVYMGPTLYWPQNVQYPNSVVVAERTGTADLLNNYFRGQTGVVDAPDLGDCFSLMDTSGLGHTEPNVQWMGALVQESQQGQQENNLDGSNTIDYVEEAEPEAPAEGDEAVAGGEAQNAG